MKVVDIAQEIYFDLNSPSDLSLAAVSFWIRANIGNLNNTIFSSFTINDSYEIVQDDAEININAVAILKKMYMVHRYAVIIRSKITEVTTNDVVEIQDQDTRVRRIDKNQLIRSISAEKKQEEEELRFLISNYRANKSTPGQIIGDDIVAGNYQIDYPYIRAGRNYGYTSY